MNDQTENGSLQILLVEDNPTDVLLIEDALEQVRGVKITLTHAKRLDEALARLQGEYFDAVLLDLGLPDSSGLETFARTQSGYPNVPILILSGLDDETLALTAVREGAQDYLVKGKINSIMLARTVRYAVERKRTVEKLAASELSYRRLFEAAQDGIFLLDAGTGQITDANPFLEKLLGYSTAEFIGKRLWEVGAFRDKAASKAAFQTLQEKGYIRYEDLPLATKDGRKINVEFVSNVYAEDGHQVIQCNIRDISERKRAEEAEQESKRFLQSTLDALSSHIAVLDESGTVIAVNRAWERFAEENDGSPAACSVGANYLEACDQAKGDWLDGAVDAARGIRDVIAGERPIFRLEYPCHSPTEQRWFNLRVTRFDDATPVRVVIAHENITARKLAENLIVISEANLAKSQEMARLGSWELDLTNLDDINANSLRWSDEIFRMLGYEPREFEPSNEAFFRAVHPDDREKLSSMMAEAIQGGKPYSIDHRIIWPDSTEHIIHAQSELIYSEDTGRPLKMVGLGQDITERKQAEIALQQNETKFRTIFETALDAILLANDDGNYIDANPAACALLGLEHQQLMGHSIADFVSPKTKDAVRAAWHEFQREGQQSGVFEFRRPDGTDRQAEFRAVARLLPGVHMSVLRDITERKQVEQELQVSEARKSAILETALDCIIVIDAQSRILEWNPASEKIFGYAREEVMGKLLPELIIPESLRAAHYSGMENYLATGEGKLLGRRVEMSALRKNGEEFPIELAITRIESEGIPVFTAYLRDITQRKQAEDKLCESEARLVNAQRIAHLGNWDWEIRTDKLHWSEEVFHLFGLVPQKLETNYAAFEKGVHPEDRVKVNLAVQDALAGKAPYNIEHRILRKDGSELVVHQQGEVSFDETGKADRMTGTVLDITERKQAEQELQESHEKFQLLVNNIADTFWIRSPDMREQIYLSPSFKPMWDIPAEDQYAAPHIWSEFIVPEDRERVQAAFSALMQDAPSINVEYRIKQPGGEMRWVQSRGYQVRNDAGELIRLTGIASDITERKQAEEALQRQQSELRVLFDLMPAMLWFKDTENRILRTNQRTAEAVGKSIEEIEGKPSLEIYPQDAAKFYADDLEVIHSAVPKLGIVEMLHDAEGEEIWLQTDKVPVCDHDGKVIGIVVMAQNVTERKQAEETLRASEERFQSIVANVPGMVYQFMIQPDGSISWPFIGQGFREIFEMELEPLAENPYLPLDKVHPEDREEFDRSVMESREAVRPRSWEGRLLLDSGKIKWIQVTSQPRRQPDGSTLWNGLVTDISSRKEAETERDRFFTISLDMLAIADYNGYFKRLNPAFEKTLGHSNAELMTKPFLEWVHPDDRAATLEVMKELDAGASSSEFVNRYRCSDGSYLWLSWVSAPFEGLIYAAAHDVTSLKKAEAALHKANDELELRVMERTAEMMEAHRQLQAELVEHKRTEETVRAARQMLQLVINHIPQAIFWKDRNCVYLGGNNRLAQDAGFGSPEELIGKEDHHMPWVEQAPAYQIDDRQVMETDTPKLNIEEPLTKADGSTVWLRTNKIPLHDSQGNVVGVLGSYEDISLQKESEAALRLARDEAETANIAKSEFLSRMSHELRTPLNAILGFGQILDKQELTPLSKESVGHILIGGRHLLTLINEILDISRVESGSLEVSLGPVALADIVGSVCALTRPLATERNLHFTEDVPSFRDFYVIANDLRLRQVLLNLLSNAIKYNREGGEVEIFCRPKTGNRIAIAVRDTGLGIAPEDLPKLFTPFERLGANSLGIEGTGLGLALAQQMVNAMDGTLNVESAVGSGSTFTIELSQAASAAGTEKLSDDTHEEYSGPLAERHYSVLCIEDNPANLRLMETIFEGRPDIILMSSIQGSTGLELALRHEPDLILLDLDLPDMHGSEVLVRLQRSAITRDIPVVIVSIDTTPEQQKKLLSAGAKAYLAKPIDVDRLLQTLDKILKEAA